MRNKVFLIRGNADISRRVTLAEFERINADHVACIAGLRRPQFLPIEVKSASQIEYNLQHIIQHWHVTGSDHLLTSEYAEMALDRGITNIRVVEGEILTVDWVFEMIKAIHRNNKQRIVECTITPDPKCFFSMLIEEERFTLEEAIDYMKSYGSLG